MIHARLGRHVYQSHHRLRTITTERGVILVLLAVATSVSAHIGPLAVSVVAVILAFAMRPTITSSISGVFARRSVGGIDPQAMIAARSIAIDPMTRLDAVSRAMLTSAGIGITSTNADLRVRGLCGSVVEHDGACTIVRGGVPQLVRTIALARRANAYARLFVAWLAGVAIAGIVAYFTGFAGVIPAVLLGAAIVGVVFAVGDLECDRHFSSLHMTRLQRKIQRRFETMFRGI